MAKTMIIDKYDDGDLDGKEGGSSQRSLLAVRTGAVIRSLGLGRSFPREPCSLLVQRGDEDSGEDCQNSLKMLFINEKRNTKNDENANKNKQSLCKKKLVCCQAAARAEGLNNPTSLLVLLAMPLGPLHDHQMPRLEHQLVILQTDVHQSGSLAIAR